MYLIEFKASVFEKDLKKMEQNQCNKILKKIERLKIDPYKSSIKKLASTHSYFRIRVGDYRVIFQIVKKDQKIIIYHIAHRKDVYKNLWN